MSAARSLGGLVTSFILELLVYPAVFFLWKKREVEKGVEVPASSEPIAV